MYRHLELPIKRIFAEVQSPIVHILGIRQSGKTTLAKRICHPERPQMFNFDLASDRAEFTDQSRHALALFAKRYRDQIIFIDEVQKYPESTNVIKYLVDEHKMRFLLTGSSELKLRKGFGDSLAGRVRTFRLYPLSITEVVTQRAESDVPIATPYDTAQQVLREVLVYGSLPHLQNILPGSAEPFLREYTDTLLSKDILEVAEVKKSTKIYALARFLALQIGQLVNINELAVLTELSRASVYHYLDILEQMSVIWRANPLSTNARKAIASKCKVYFTDLGIRNALVGDFSPFEQRLDRGGLLENAVMLGMKRTIDYQQRVADLGFFRSHSGTEIDIVVKEQGTEKLYEVKNRGASRSKSGVELITLENTHEFLL